MTEKTQNLVTVEIADATDEQLREFCRNNLGLPVGDQETRASLEAKIQTTWGKSKITVSEGRKKATRIKTEAAAVVDEGGIPVDKRTNMVVEPIWEILIPETEEPGGKDPVFLGVNGRGMFVERSVPSEIKHRYYADLVTNTKTVYIQVDERTIEPRVMPAHPFNVLTPPDRRHLLAWLKQDAMPAKKRKRVTDAALEAEA